jgi:MYXO-CTERM domain-containing protein
MRFKTTSALVTSVLLAASTLSTTAAAKPFVVVEDVDGTIAKGRWKTVDDVQGVADPLADKFAAEAGAKPEVLSVWSNFPMNGGAVSTIFVPYANDVAGIGLDPAGSPKPPLRAALLHNDVTQLAKRAATAGAPSVDGFARYLFLLELSHLWGPALRFPADAANGLTGKELIGFPFHWSFWMDAGGSIAGGNRWKDNGDGTYTVIPQKPGEMKYTTLDLYAMGLAQKSEVSPFGVLYEAVVPPTVKDPYGGGIKPESFPWFGSTPFTVSAKRKTVTIDDVVKSNGVRAPATAPGELSLGIVLLVAKGTTDAQRQALEETFTPIANDLVPAFHDATGGRGTLRLVAPPEPAPVVAPEEPAPAEPAAPPQAPRSSDGGCSAAPSPSDGGGLAWAAALALGLWAARRRRSSLTRETPRAAHHAPILAVLDGTTPE